MRSGKKSEVHENPLVTLVFDEARILTKNDNFLHLRRVLRDLNKCSVFSFFLSTIGKTMQFVPSADQDMSLRILRRELSLIKPFTDLGFDVLTPMLKEGTVSILKAATERFMVQFGRPL